MGKRKSSIKNTASILLIMLTALLVSCEKEVDINLDSGEPKMVIEGGIENNLPPIVILTRSVGYFADIDLNTVQNSYVHDASVTVTNGSNTITLKEYSVDTGTNGNKFFFYTVDTSQPQLFIGQLEQYYNLKVEVDGDTYEAITKIPTPTPLDSIVPFYPQSNADIADIGPDARILKVYFKDPDTLGNYIRYYTQRNNEPFYAALASVYSDEFINGTQFTIEFPLGEPRFTTKTFDSLGLAYVGDTVTFRWSAIDKGTYDFWSQYEYALGTLGSPFASPIRVKSNISNGALGVWGGYGSIYYTVVME